MTDNITVSRELLRQVLDALREIAWCNGSKWQSDRAQGMMEPLRAALEPAPVQEQHPVAEVVWSQDTNCEFKFKMLVELACKEGIPVKLYAGPFESGGLYWHDTAKDKPTAPPPDRMAQLEAANTNLFEQGQKMHKRIQELELDCKIGAQEMVKAYEEIDNLKAQVSWQKPVAWCQLGLDGKSIAYFDGKPMIMTGHVGNQHHPTPLFTAQPRKAVKLSDLELLNLWEAAPLGTLASTRLQAVQAAVWAKLGVEL